MNIISGTVIQGKRKGRVLGFPTANIKVSSILDFGPGVYAGYLIFDGAKHKAALYLAGDKIIEAFILNFEGDLYKKGIDVEIVKKIRDKQNFKNDKEATEQITKDVAGIKKCLQELSEQQNR